MVFLPIQQDLGSLTRGEADQQTCKEKLMLMDSGQDLVKPQVPMDGKVLTRLFNLHRTLQACTTESGVSMHWAKLRANRAIPLYPPTTKDTDRHKTILFIFN